MMPILQKLDNYGSPRAGSLEPSFFLLIFDPTQYMEYFFSVRLSYNILLTGSRKLIN